MEAVEEINEISIAEFLDKYYEYHEKTIIINEAKIILDRLQKNGKKLRSVDVSKYIQKARSRDDEFDLIALLTERHNLSEKQFTLLWRDLEINFNPKMDDDAKYLEWINNLVKNDYSFSRIQLKKIEEYFPKKIVDIIFKKDVGIADIEDFQMVCKNGNVDDIKNFFNKYQIIPDDGCLVSILENFRINIGWEELYYYLVEIGMKFEIGNKFIDIMKTFNKYDFLDLMIKDGVKLSIEDLKILFDLMDFKNIIKYTRIALENKVELKLDLLLSCKNNNDDYESLLELFDLFFVEFKMVPTQDFCDKILGSDFVDLYEYLLKNNIFIHGQKALEEACSKGNFNIVKDLINRKYQMDSKCFRLLLDNYSSPDSVLEFLNFSLNEGGLKMTYSIIEKLFVRSIVLDNLNDYNLKYDDNIYFLFYSNAISLEKIKKKNYYYKYYVNMIEDKKMKSLIEFREKFCDYPVDCDEIKKYMLKNNLVPDQYCYENSLLRFIERDAIVDWLEKDYGFKPTIMLLKRINCENNDMSMVLQYTDKYFDTDKHHPSNSEWKKLFIVHKQ